MRKQGQKDNWLEVNGSMLGSDSRKPSSSSVINRNTLEVHLWSRWYFSSQLKQKPRSRHKVNSSWDKRLMDTEGVGFEGVGTKGEVCERVEGAKRR